MFQAPVADPYGQLSGDAGTIEAKAKKTITNLVRNRIPRVRDDAVQQGQHTRNIVVLPSQITSVLRRYVHQSLLEPSDINKVALGICREINAASFENPQQAVKQPLKAAGTQYSYPVFKGKEDGYAYDKADSIKFPFDCYVELSNDQQKVRVVLMAPKQSNPAYKTTQFIADGKYKNVFRAFEFAIPLKFTDASHAASSSRSSRMIEPRRIVLIEPKIGDDPLNPDDGIEVLRCLKKHELTNQISGGNLIGAPKLLFSVENLNDARYIMAESETNLRNARAQKLVLVGPDNEKKEIKFSTYELACIYRDVADKMILFEKCGLVHRDIKSTNIFIDYIQDSKGSRLAGQLADFDLNIPIGHPDREGEEVECVYWDKGSLKGCPSSFTDCFAMALSMFGTLEINLTQVYKSPAMYLSEGNIDIVRNSEFFKLISNCLGKPANILDRSPLHFDSKLSKVLSSGTLTKENIIFAAKDDLKNLQLTDAEIIRIKDMAKKVILFDFVFDTAARAFRDNDRVYYWIENNVLTITDDAIRTITSDFEFQGKELFLNEIDPNMEDEEPQFLCNHTHIIFERDKINIDNNGNVKYNGKASLDYAITVLANRDLSDTESNESIDRFYASSYYKRKLNTMVRDKLLKESVYVLRKKALQNLQKETSHITASEIKHGLERVIQEMDQL